MNPDETLNTNEEVVNNEGGENLGTAENPTVDESATVEGDSDTPVSSEDGDDSGEEGEEGSDDEDDRPEAEITEEAADESSETPRDTYYAGYLVLKEEPVNINGVERVKLRVRDTQGQEQEMIVLPEEYEADKNIK